MVCEQVDGDEEPMLLVEERNVLDDNEIENEVIELEFEKTKVMNDGTIEENLSSKHFGYCCRVSTPEKSEKPHLVVFGFPAYSSEYVEKDK